MQSPRWRVLPMAGAEPKESCDTLLVLLGPWPNLPPKLANGPSPCEPTSVGVRQGLVLAFVGIDSDGLLGSSHEPPLMGRMG
jgi:hypothetical protein